MVKLGTPLHGPMLLLSRCVWGKTAHSEPTRLAFFSRDDIKKRAFKSVSSLSSTWYFVIEHFLSGLMSSRDDRILIIFAQAQVPINLCVCLRLVRRGFFSFFFSFFLTNLCFFFFFGTLYDTLPFFDNKIFCSESTDVNFIRMFIWLFTSGVKRRIVCLLASFFFYKRRKITLPSALFTTRIFPPTKLFLMF